jgi:cytochrome c oxidase subunit IV
VSEGTVVERVEEAGKELEVVAEGELRHSLESAPGLLPGEVRPHPSPFRYVVIAVVLCVATALEISLYYLEGDVPDGLIITLLLAFAVIKFGLVAAWYMHLRTDKAIFSRFFVLGIAAAIILYLVVLATLGVF